MSNRSGLIGICLLTWHLGSSVPVVSAENARTVGVNVYQIGKVATERVYIEFTSASVPEIVAYKQALIEAGAQRVNYFVPSLLVCEIPPGLDPRAVDGAPPFRLLDERHVGQGAPGVSDEILHVKRCYDMAQAIVQDGNPLTPPGDFQDRVFIVPPEIVAQSASRPGASSSTEPVERTIQQNSEMMVGNILVRLVYPESEGIIENTENWTDDELRDANQGAVSGALAFQQTFAYLPMNFVFTTAERVPCDFEPIKHTSEDDAVTWIADTMRSLGYGQRKDTRVVVHDYNNDGRARFGTTWVYTAFIADSRNEPGHIFGGSFGGAGYTAYAFLGGPYLVIPFPAGAIDPNEIGEVRLFSQIFQHEMVHSFWGLDEYPSAPTDCPNNSGYLSFSNRNKVKQGPDGQLGGCPVFVDCLMWNARAPVEAGRPLCFFTAGQIGTVDANGNDIPDVFDRAPIVEFENAAEETIQTSTITLRMKAISRAVPNLNPHQPLGERIDYAAPLKDATISVNGVGATRVLPDDGKWNEVEEDLTFVINGLSAGVTQLEVVLRNSFGRSSGPIIKRIYFIGVKFALFDIDVKRTGIQVNWQTVGESFGARLDLMRIENTPAGPDTLVLVADAQSTGEPGDLFLPYAYFDTDVVAGTEYKYYVQAYIELEDGRRFEPTSNVFATRAMLPMSSGAAVSSVAPNPFREVTSISIDVPKTFKQSDVNDRSSAASFGIPQEQQTPVSVTVFDVRGRLVKKIYNGAMFARVQTFNWDGTNRKNERVPSGIYFIKAEAGPVSEVRKVVVVR